MLLGGAATVSQAATLNGQTFGQFTGTDGVNVDGSGQYAVWPDNPCAPTFCTDKSYLTFITENMGDDDYPGPDNDYDFNYTNITAGEYLIGGLKWKNASSAGSITDDAFSLFATLSLDLDIPELAIANQAVSFAINNTANPPGDTLGSSALMVGGLTYNLALPIDLGDGLLLSGFTIKGDGHPDNTYDPVTGVWELEEDKKAKLYFYANVTQIPLPAAGWMLIAGLGGLAALRRRRSPDA